MRESFSPHLKRLFQGVSRKMHNGGSYAFQYYFKANSLTELNMDVAALASSLFRRDIICEPYYEVPAVRDWIREMYM
jgi:hypothetical protein